MFFAINSKTREIVNSLTVEQNASYQFIEEDIWFADPDEIESCPGEIDIEKIKVRFRKGATDIINFNGTKYDASPHFFIPNKSKLGINTIPESKEHKLAKNWIYNKIKDKKLILNYSEQNKPYKYKNSVNLFDLPIDLEKLGIEIRSTSGGKSRVADIICPLLKKHNIFGNGIIFEIQFSNQRNKTKTDRELDWAIRGYSIAWLFAEDFNTITDLIIDLKKDSINVSSFASLIKLNKKDFVRSLKYVVQEECRKLDSKKDDIINEIDIFLTLVRKEKISQIKIEKSDVREALYDQLSEIRKTLQPICPRCEIPMLLKKGDNYFWGCTNFPTCKQTSSYVEDRK